ncbi:uncharacterized protein I303_106129 [Kwoniella dejecticola CBS 10117]|uniref:Uncharacterized protein n=1 Tax=Kwoniella dejecticola CBS 10117 TaxID=1296121 RepID=A0A1A6A1D7_9TREE|nr:uncharacterized protein I303_06148 [Kwoniella dejecticola CBS 10117]OBR83865.1 hypothetical protein I303_06148 [Kwoniella dejecticola CBS 10117]
MKTTSAIIAASALAGSAYAQANVGSIAQNALGYLSGGCIAAVMNLTNPQLPLYQCLDGNLLASIVTSNTSIIEPMENYLDAFCSAQPCSNATLTEATQTIINGCASDLSQFGVTNQTVEWAIAQYPLARDVLCLKTSDPFTSNSTSSSSANSTSASSSANSTTSTNSTSSNGTFCAVSLLTELQSYLGEDLTPTNIATTALGGNSTALDNIKSIPPTALCDECIFGALSLVEEQYPQLGNITVVGNYTLNQFLETTCNKTTSAEGLTISNNGTLPTNVTESAVNSTLTPQYVNGTSPQTNLTSLTSLLMPSATASGASGAAGGLVSSYESQLSAVTASVASATNLAARAAVTDVKKRWIGQQ